MQIKVKPGLKRKYRGCSIQDCVRISERQDSINIVTLSKYYGDKKISMAKIDLLNTRPVIPLITVGSRLV